MSIEGRLNETGIKKGATWGTEVDINASGTLVLPLNAGVPQQNLLVIPEDSASGAGEIDVDLGDYGAHDFNLDFDLRYDTALWVLLALLFGTAGAPVQQGSTAAYKHHLQMADSIAGLFFTYATKKHDKIHVVPSVKVYKAKFSFNGGKVALTLSCRGSHLIDNSAIVTSFSSATVVPDKHNRVLSRECVFRMNAQGGAALSDNDKIGIRDLDFEIERKVDAYNETGQRFIVEPLETDKWEVRLVLNLNRMNDVNKVFLADCLAENEKKADLTFTGRLIETTYYHSVKFQFPRLKLAPAPEYPHAPVIPAKISLRGLTADAAPTGMTGITKAVDLEVINKRTTDLLA